MKAKGPFLHRASAALLRMIPTQEIQKKISSVCGLKMLMTAFSVVMTFQ